MPGGLSYSTIDALLLFEKGIANFFFLSNDNNITHVMGMTFSLAVLAWIQCSLGPALVLNFVAFACYYLS